MAKNEILKLRDGRILYFFLNNGLCVKNIASDDCNYKLIYDKAVCDFYVTEGNFNDLIIVCQDIWGKVIFLKEEKDDFIKKTILESKDKKPQDKYFKIINAGKMYLSYVISYNNKLLLINQTLEDNKTPLVVDEIRDYNYFTYKINNNIIYFYNRENDYGIRIFEKELDNFGDFLKVGKGKIVTMIYDIDKYFYMVVKRDDKFYFKKTDILNISKDDEILLREIKEKDEVNILIEKDKLWILYKRYNLLYGIWKNFNDKFFSMPYSFINKEDILEFETEIIEKDYIIENTFGYLFNLKPNLILYKNLFLKKENREEKEEFNENNQYIKRITKLEIRVRELENALNKINENYHIK